ncbi:RWD domain-containing protein 4 [Caerostris extrusa]|uniref:RWD domain-containing protein 4 n=1 Tax=Caerostris extrusa TaxID=172846 RepID=A0AAV4SDJ2_CAEEX|nr:RWD domain-containing protein 4 [Caerostris extrusa]
MSCEETQAEETEVLLSIYDGDQCFKQISSSCYQYRIGDDDDIKSFLLEISWVPKYPDVIPNINLDAFYNKKLIPEVKSNIVTQLTELAESNIGTPMTYTLFEWAKENAEELTKLQPEHLISQESKLIPEDKAVEEEMVQTKKEKKPQLTKQQKRRLAERLDAKGEHPRGWDWVDVIKHLSQIGPKAESTS